MSQPTVSDNLPRALRKQVREGAKIEAQFRKELEDASNQQDSSYEDTHSEGIERKDNGEKGEHAFARKDQEPQGHGQKGQEPQDRSQKGEKQQEEVALTPAPPTELDLALIATKRKAEQAEAELRRFKNALDNEQKLRKKLEADVAKYESQTDTITDADKDLYGEDMLNLIGRAVRKETKDLVAENKRLRDLLEATNSSVKQTQDSIAQNHHQILLSKIEAAVPDYKAIDNNPDFAKWMGQDDPVFGSRMDAFISARDAGDAQTLIKFFKAYKASKVPARPSVDAMLAPDSNSSDSRHSTEDSRVWTRAQIAAFYRDVRQGKYRDDPKTMRAYEKSIIDANNKGLVR